MTHEGRACATLSLVKALTSAAHKKWEISWSQATRNLSTTPLQPMPSVPLNRKRERSFRYLFILRHYCKARAIIPLSQKSSDPFSPPSYPRQIELALYVDRTSSIMTSIFWFLEANKKLTVIDKPYCHHGNQLVYNFNLRRHSRLHRWCLQYVRVGLDLQWLTRWS